MTEERRARTAMAETLALLSPSSTTYRMLHERARLELEDSSQAQRPEIGRDVFGVANVFQGLSGCCFGI